MKNYLAHIALYLLVIFPLATSADPATLNHAQVQPLLDRLYDPDSTLVTDYNYLNIASLLRAQQQACDVNSSSQCAALTARLLARQNRWAGQLAVPTSATQQSFDPDLPAGTCVTVTVAVEPQLKMCRVDAPLDSTQLVTTTGHVAQIGSNTEYVRLLGGGDAYQVATAGIETLYVVTLEIPDRDLVTGFELVFVNIDSLVSMSLNDGPLPIQLNNDRRLCGEQIAIVCAPLTAATLDSLPGFDVTRYLNPGLNHIGITVRSTPQANSQIVFRVRTNQSEVISSRDDELPFCSQVTSAGCELAQERQPCDPASEDDCDPSVRVYHCLADQSDTHVRCGLPQTCAGASCTPRVATDNLEDFAPALARLEMARQAGHYLDNYNLRIFAGTEAQCRDKVLFGLSDCCRADATGNNSTNRQALAQLGISLAVRGIESIGSEHTFDSLFLNNRLANSLLGLGKGVQGISSAFAPSLSYYGLEVSISNGVLSFGFDPASFALAVSLAVLANLLECDNQEQLLGLQVGAGLCTKVRDWCSSRGLFGCREEREAYCCYNSRLARLIAGQANVQLNRAIDDCSGLKVEQLGELDFSEIDLEEFVAELGIPDVDSELLRFRSENAAELKRSRQRGTRWVELK